MSTNNDSKSSSLQKFKEINRLNSTAHKTEHKSSTQKIEHRPVAQNLKLDKKKKSPDLKDWCCFLSSIDGMISEKESQQTYKAYVGKGNNSILIKNVIKSRPWWILTQ